MDQSRPVIYLKPGEIHFAKQPAKIITVLGSCVSVIMYSRSRGAGAICHAVMPSLDNMPASKSRRRNAFQYVDKSIEWMLSRFKESGIDETELEVKIYGGAEIFSQKESCCSSIQVGKRNIETAIKIIDNNNLKLKAWNVGGNKGRKLIFYSDTGDVITNFVGRQIQTPAEFIYGRASNEENTADRR